MQKLYTQIISILFLIAILLFISCDSTSDFGKYPQGYPQETHMSVIKALTEKDYSYFKKYLLNPDEHSFWENAETLYYDSLLNFLGGIKTKAVRVTGYSETDGTASLFGKNGEAVYHFIKDKWYFTTGFPPYEHSVDSVQDSFMVSKNKESIKVPTRNNYLIKIDSTLILFKATDIAITHHSIQWKDKFLNYTQESSNVELTVYDKNFQKLFSKEKSIINGSWSPFSRISWEVIRELLPFDSIFKINDLSIWFNYHSIQSWWISFSKDIEIAELSGQFELNKNSLKALDFKKLKNKSDFNGNEDCELFEK